MTTARIVQLSDTHLGTARGVPAQWAPTVAWLGADQPDLVVHSGDVVLVDPDDPTDRAFAVELIAELPGEVVVIPGNHDVGEYAEGHAVLEARADVFRATFGGDRFARDIAGWRIIGVNAYLLDQQAHDVWFRSALAVDGPLLVFVHQPVRGDRDDDFRMTAAARAAFEAATADVDVRIVASGHRHRAHRDGRYVWCPSLTVSGEDYDDVGDPAVGLLEHTIDDSGGHAVRVVRPWAP